MPPAHPLKSCLYEGWVTHHRLYPRHHRFRYSVFALLIDLDERAALDQSLKYFAWNRWGLFSFHDRDHGPIAERGTQPDLRRWLDEILADAGLAADGPVRVLCYPRIFGYVFNPLSVWFCHDRNGALTAIVYEVHNTYNERHAYVLPVTGEQALVNHSCDKQFYVSPFLSNDCRYHFCLGPPGDSVTVAIHETEAGRPVLNAAFAGDRRPLTDAGLLKMLLAYPLMTLKVVVAIHFEAARLMLKGIRRHPHSPKAVPAR